MGCFIALIVVVIIIATAIVIFWATITPLLILWLVIITISSLIFVKIGDNNIKSPTKTLISSILIILGLITTMGYCGGSRDINFLRVWQGCGSCLDDSTKQGMCKTGRPTQTWLRSKEDNITLQACNCTRVEDCLKDEFEQCLQIYYTHKGKRYKTDGGLCLTEEDIEYYYDAYEDVIVEKK